MAREPLGRSPRWREIANTIFEDTSQLGLEEIAAGKISGPSFGRYRAGKIPERSKLPILTAHFHRRICKHYGDQVTRVHGECNAETAHRWLYEELYGRPAPFPDPEPDRFADHRSSYNTRPSSLDAIIAGYQDVEGLPDSDVQEIRAVLAAMVAAKRAARGLD